MISKSKYMAKLLKKSRKLKSMTQGDLTKELGWNTRNAQYVSNIERGKCRFPPDHVGKLSIAFSISPDVIIDAMIRDFACSLTEEVFGYEKSIDLSGNFGS